jgi:perosamine synthetase
MSDAASFSFQSSKHMTSGEGGMVTTSDKKYARNIRRFGSLGYAAVGAAPGEGKISKETIQDPQYERHVSLGWNYRMPELCAAVALAQLERLPELIKARTTAARLYSESVAGCEWLVPQHVPPHCVHPYWTYALSIKRNVRVSWRDFRRKYMDFGGDGIYAAWRLTYLEPMFRSGHGLGIPGTSWNHAKQKYRPGLCPVAESFQPRLLQLKTNYFNRKIAEEKADALARTIAYFDERIR